MDPTQFDVIVIGGGIMGSCTAYQLAKRGHKTLLLEQFDFLHHRGSSHGESRTIRATYPESYYSSMVIESAKLFESAQSESGYKVYYPNRQLDMGPANDSSLRAMIENCKSWGGKLDYRVLKPEEVAHEFGHRVSIPEGWVGVVSQLGGVIKPSKAVSMFQSLALKNGAVLKDNMEVIGIKKKTSSSSGVVVTTANGSEFHGRKCVVTAGPWTKRLISKVTSGGVEIPIQPLETTILYWKVKPGHEREFTMEGGLPTFASYGFPYIYGTPSLEFPGLIKVGVHAGRFVGDPTDRTWAALPGSVEMVGEWLKDRFPGRIEVGRGPVMVQSCMYSMTPDEDFVVDYAGDDDDVIVVGGFSGHGFKMGPVIGRIVADLVENGKADGVAMEKFRLKRFEKNPKGNVKGFAEQVGTSMLTSKY